MKKLLLRYGIVFNLVLGVLLRLYHLGTRDFWYDEAFSGIVVKEGWGRMVEIISRDTHPPLYFIGLKAWGFFFNYSVYGLRLFSVVWGVLAIYLIYLILKQIAGFRSAWVGSFLLAVNPFAIQYSQEARMYAMLGTLLLAVSYFFFKARSGEKLRDYILFGVSFALALLTHYFAFIFGIIILLWLIYDLYLKSKLTFGSFVREVWDLVKNKKMWLGILTVLVIFALWFPSFRAQWETRGAKIDWIFQPNLGDVVSNFQIFLIGSPQGMMGAPEPNEVRFLSPEVLIILVLGFIGIILISLVKQKNYLAWYFAIGSLGYVFVTYLLFFLNLDYLISRYLIGAGYLFIVLISLWLGSLKTKLALGIVVGYLALVLLIDFPVLSTGYNQLKRAERDYRNNNFYTLDTYEYVIAKYYFGFDKVILFNADWPEYNPKDWLGVNGEIKRATKWEEVEEDSRGLVLWNETTRPSLNFDYMHFAVVGGYTNLNILQARSD